MAAIGIKKKKKGEENPAGAPAGGEGDEVAAEGGKKKKGKKGKKGEGEDEGEGGGKSKLITVVLIIVLVAAAIFAGGVVTTKILLPTIMNDILKKVENNPGGSEVDPGLDEEPENELKIVATHPLGEMTIQLAPNQNGVRSALLMEMGVGFTRKKAAEAFEEKKLEVQDIVLSTIMEKSKEELSSKNDIDSLKKVLANKIQKLFVENDKKNQVHVVIGKFLIQ